MAEPTTDQYERQLYSMFKSFDVNDEESLDESAVTQLCDALQLEERGAALVGALFERRPGRASFQQFRAALLRELAEPREPAPSPPAPGEPAPRPPRAASAERARLRRGAGASAEPPLEHGRPLGRDEALALCRALRMPSIDRHLVERIFDESPSAETTVGEFFERLNSSLAAVVRSGGAAGDEEPPAATERVLEAWEAAGVRRPRRLLADLGFVGAAARLPDLERALDDELRGAGGPEPAEGRAALLAAALAVSRLRAAGAAERRAAAAAERDKLRADLAAADERARVLAREVDESHARLETDLKASLRRAEAKLADEARRAAADAAAERERAAAERAALEGEAARARDAAAGGRAEAAAERARADGAEARAAAAEERAGAAERGAARAADELRAARAEAERAAAAAEALRGAGARAEELARDNQRLRDRADELAAALDARPAPAPAPAPGPAPGALAAELDDLLSPEEAEGEAPRSAASGDDEPDEEKQKLIELVRELEGAVEALRAEYEACEEYWGGKLRAERAAHEEEARAEGARLRDLTGRIAEFERRLAPPAPALPAIPEAPALEAQVAELEAEFARHRRDAAARARALAERLARAERRRAPPAPAPPPPAHPPAPELAARCARAEAAVRRLHARLAAADLLVKELYVENCHLAHARAPPL